MDRKTDRQTDRERAKLTKAQREADRIQGWEERGDNLLSYRSASTHPHNPAFNTKGDGFPGTFKQADATASVNKPPSN